MTTYDARPGDGDLEVGLRASMTACVTDVRMPAGLLDRAAARNRTKTARKRLIGATSTVAVVAATAAVIVSVAGQSAGRKAPAPSAAASSAAAAQAQTAAYILRRAAAAEVNSYRLISVSQDSGSGTVYTDVATQQQRIVAGLRDSAGEPYFQITDVIKGDVWTDTTVDNQHHVYAIQTASAKDHGLGAVTISSFLPLQTQSDPAVVFQAALKQGAITVAGHQNLGGRDTILIRVKALTKKERAAAGMPELSKGAPIPSDEIWVDASTYLVVQTKTFKGTGGAFITRVSWLPATPENLAKLTITPPPGYTQVPYSDMAKYLGPIS
jgi:hypothetical protein